MTLPAPSPALMAEQSAERAAQLAGVRLAELEQIEDLRLASQLLESVWGRTPEGAPMGSEVLRSMVHADGLVSAAYDAGNELVGVAVLGRAKPGAAYSYLAASRPGAVDRGIGFALKQHQRAWSLARDITTISWTFDPLVSRNARFNLTKLGAVVREFEPAFYGVMSDELNGDDVSDRLVGCWELDTLKAAAAAAGTGSADPAAEQPAADQLAAAESGPDGQPAWLIDGAQAWCRVPTDIVELRRSDPAQASQWRDVTSRWLQPALSAGYVAIGVSRTGWYRLIKENLNEHSVMEDVA